MPRVNINGTNHQVEVEDRESALVDVARTAQRLWNETAPPREEPRPGPATGFGLIERHTVAALPPMNLNGR